MAIHWEGEPGDTRTLTYADLHRSVSQAANALHRPGRTAEGPRYHLSADDPRGCHRDAGLRAYRRHPLGRLRWLLRGRARRAGSRTRTPPSSSRLTAATDAARRPLSSRRSTTRVDAMPDRAQRARRTPDRPGRRVDRGPRSLVARHRRHGEPGTHRCAIRRRASALHPLHVRHHREAQGNPRTRPAATSPRSPGPITPSSTSSRTPTSSGARPTSAG